MKSCTGNKEERRTDEDGREDVVEAELGEALVQVVQRDREAEARDEHVRHELQTTRSAPPSLCTRTRKGTYAVARAGRVQRLAERAPRDRVAVVRLHLLPGPDVAALHVEQDVAVARDDRAHDREVQHRALWRRRSVRGGWEREQKLTMMVPIVCTVKVTRGGILVYWPWWCVWRQRAL